MDPSNYFTNDYQTVTDGDARAIADALSDALDDIPGQRNPDAAIPPTTLVEAAARLSAAQTPSERDAIMAQAGFIWMPGRGLEGFSTLNWPDS